MSYKHKGNKNSEKLITYNGKTQNMLAWANELGITASTLSRRFSRSKMSLEQAMQPGNLSGKPITYKGRTYKSRAQLAKAVKVSAQTIRYRLDKNTDPTKRLPTRKPTGRFLYGSKAVSLKELARIHKINCQVLTQRIYTYKWPLEKALKTPVRKYQRKVKKAA